MAGSTILRTVLNVTEKWQLGVWQQDNTWRLLNCRVSGKCDAAVYKKHIFSHLGYQSLFHIYIYIYSLYPEFLGSWFPKPLELSFGRKKEIVIA